MRDDKKRGILLFKTLFELPRYDFRFPDYRRAKKRVIFVYSDLSLASPTYPKFQTSDRRDDSWKDIVRVPRKNI